MAKLVHSSGIAAGGTNMEVSSTRAAAGTSAELNVDSMVESTGRFNWGLLVWPPVAISLVLLVIPQGVFVAMSLRRNLGFGRFSSDLTFGNYAAIVRDGFYLESLWLTFYLSAGAVVIGLLLAVPTAYLLARIPARWASWLICLLLIASFVTVVIKVIGLLVLLSREGLVNNFLVGLGITADPLNLVHNEIGVLIGLVQYTLPLLVMVVFSVMQTIPRNLEYAAEIHGATHWTALRRIILPLAMPGIIAAGLMAFNMNAGAFTSAILLGGGRVLTLPVLIERTVRGDVDYPTAAALSTILVAVVFALNIAVGSALVRWRRRLRR